MSQSPLLIKTISDLEREFYGYRKKAPWLTKADAPFQQGTQGFLNRLFGAYAWAQLNMEANGFSILPKYIWRRSGFRTIEARAGALNTNGNTTLGGTPESGNLSDTVKPTLNTQSLKIKTVQFPFSESIIAEFLQTKSEDDVWGGYGQAKLFAAVNMKENIHKMILADNESQELAAGAPYAGTNDLETLDRIISSGGTSSEEAFFNGQSDWYDPYSTGAGTSTINRDGSTTYNSTVNSASGTIGTRGQLNDDVVRTFLRTIKKKAGKYPSVFLGSEEAYSEIQGIYTPQVRYNLLGEGVFSVDVNGVQTYNGVGVGLHVPTIYGTPYIGTKDAPQNNAAEIGRILAIDFSDTEMFGEPRLGVMVAEPVTYYEAGRNSPGWPFNVGKLDVKNIYLFMGETVCRHYISQGKLRDIKL